MGGPSMRQPPVTGETSSNDHLTWVRTRMMLDQEFLESVRHGFSLIAAGFGSFSIFQGLTIGEREVSELPKTFALVVTGIGVIVILLAIAHERKMTVFIDENEFGTGRAPALPNENRPLYLAAAAAVIGLISFVALLLLPS
jgi:uncharacterized membrane protein YidH (DUF202 family)